MATIAFAVKGMTCEGCENSVVNAVTRLAEVVSARADHVSSTLEVTFVAEPDESAVQTALEDAGFDFGGRRPA